MDNYTPKLIKAPRYTASVRTPKSHPTKSLVHYDACNKENVLNASNLDRTRIRGEEKRTFSNSSSSLEKRSKGGIGLHIYNGSAVTPLSNNIYTSPRYAEINLLQENFKTAGIAKYNNYVENSSKKEGKKSSNATSDGNKHFKRNKEADLKNKLKENHHGGFEERASEKVTIYTRLLSSMKPATPKSRELSSQKQSSAHPQRASIDLLGLNSQAKKAYVNGPTVCGRLDKKAEVPKKKEAIVGTMTTPTGSFKQEEPRSSQKIGKEKEEFCFKQEKPLKREKFVFPKKLSIDIQEPVQTEGSDSYKTGGHSASNAQSRSIPKVYESFSHLKKGFNKAGYVAKSNAMEGGIRNSRENSYKDLKSVFKSSTPKAMSNQNPPEMKKLPGSSSYKNLLKAGGPPVNLKVTGVGRSSDQRKRPLSLTKNPKKKDIYLFEKIQEDEHQQSETRTQGSVSTKNLKDFITQVNPGLIIISTRFDK